MLRHVERGNEMRLACDCYYLQNKKPHIIYLITGDIPIIVIACGTCFESLAVQPDRVIQGAVKNA